MGKKNKKSKKCKGSKTLKAVVENPLIVAPPVQAALAEHPPVITVAAALADFLSELDAAVQREELAPATYDYYKLGSRVLLEMHGAKPCNELTQKDVYAYLEKQNRQPNGESWAPDTIRRNLSTFQRWQQHAIEMKALAEPIFRKPLQKPAGRRRDFLPTGNEVGAIHGNTSPEFQLIHRALRQCGARPGELASATIADWDRDQNKITLKKHKGSRFGRLRTIDVGEKLKAILMEAIGDRTEGPIFRTPRLKQWTTNSASAAFRAARNKLGLPRKYVNYITRREYASAVHKKTRDLVTTKKLMGHVPDVTEGYITVENDELRDFQDAAELACPESAMRNGNESEESGQ
jgi:integrase